MYLVVHLYLKKVIWMKFDSICSFLGLDPKSLFIVQTFYLVLLITLVLLYVYLLLLKHFVQT